MGGHNNRCHKTKFAFSVVGDVPYEKYQLPQFETLVHKVLNKEDNEFVAHIGDMQTDPRGFTDASLPIALNESEWKDKRDNIFWKIKKPFIMTPGDNDWADTTKSPIDNPDPVGTLNAIRKVFYKKNNTCFPFKVKEQPDEFPEFSAYVENKRWIIGDVLFVTIHTIAGRGNNGLNPSDDPAVQAESLVRIQADVAWINRAFEVAERKKVKGLVILSHAAINWTDPQLGFVEIIDAVKAGVFGNRKLKTLYIFGDNHQFNVQKAFQNPDAPGQYENFTAIEVPGAPRSGIGSVLITDVAGGTGRVKIYVNSCSKDLFSLSLEQFTQS